MNTTNRTRLDCYSYLYHCDNCGREETFTHHEGGDRGVPLIHGDWRHWVGSYIFHFSDERPRWSCSKSCALAILAGDVEAAYR